MTRGRTQRRPHPPKRKQPNLVWPGLILLALLVCAFSLSRGEEGRQEPAPPAAEVSLAPREVAEPEPEPEAPQRLKLVFAGDVLIHQSLLNQAEAEGDFDFSWLFRYTSPIFQEADWVCGNMEGSITGEPYSGYPVFRAPVQLAEDLKAAGFDCLTTVNNHFMDGQIEGISKTLENLQAAGLKTLGTRLQKDSDPFLLLDMNGIKVALSAFSYESYPEPDYPGRRIFNGAPLPLEWVDRVDSFASLGAGPDAIQESEAKLKERIAAMRAGGADLIVMLMHWGTEYHSEPDTWQTYYAELLAAEGVDLVIGTHPHVVQPLAALPANNAAGRMICYYSLGNFVSNQQPETGDCGGRAEEGALAAVTLEKQGDRARIVSADYIPLFMAKTYPAAERTLGWALPVRSALEHPEEYAAEGITARLEQALQSTEEVMGEAIHE